MLICSDCKDAMATMAPQSVDMVFCSPPYENARTYGIDFDHAGRGWVKWAYERYDECLRVSRGLVAWVVQGKTRNYKWSATPALLMAALHGAGVNLRNPAIFHRVGIPGSGGPDWLRSDYEWIICASQRGRLPWSDNTACGHPPKYPPGGAPSHRLAGGKRATGSYAPPPLANPGNVIHCAVGGGRMGSDLSHENEAPFPEPLAEFFVKSFCPPGGVVLDPFCGSGTTGAVALRNGRQFIGIDVRQSQVDLTEQRLSDEHKRVFAVP